MNALKERTAPSSQDPGLLEPTLASADHEASAHLRDILNNEELIHVAERYLRDEEETDIQRMLLDEEARPKVISELANIAEVANWSLVESLLDSSNGQIEGVSLIAGSQSAVDGMSEQLRALGSPLFTESKYPLPNDPEYWKSETDFINTRKQSGDEQWSTIDDPESANSLRQEAIDLQDDVQLLLQEAINKAGVEKKVVGVSQRVKGEKSLLGKVEKFRQSEWGKDATVADAVDLIGGRIVVEDLSSLEETMLALESMEQDGSIVVLRKENKFIGNDGRPDPYRAIHYVVAIPGTMHTAEIQIKTLSSMVASDLYHNAVYKPHILNLPGELKDSVSAYNWRSVEKEMEEYSTAKGAEINSPELEARNDVQDIELAIESLDYNVFYDLVLSTIEPDKPVASATKELIARFHNKETGKLIDLMDLDEELVLSLAASAHNAYYDKAVADMVSNPNKPQLGCRIPEEALKLLPDSAQALYLSRFDRFDGTNNKLTVIDLELDKLDEASLVEFFKLAGKDPANGQGKIAELMNAISQHRSGQEQTEQLKKIALVNMFHAPFDELLVAPEDSAGKPYDTESAQAKTWRNTLVSSQLKAIATSSMLTEIGGYDQSRDFRDITAKVFEDSEFTARELLTFAIFISADRTDSEFSDTAYSAFVTNESSEWARDFDKTIDTAVMKTTMETQVITINKIVEETQSNVQLARLQKARMELVAKQLRFVGRHGEAEALRPVIKSEVISMLEQSDQLTAQEVNQRFEAMIQTLDVS